MGATFPHPTASFKGLIPWDFQELNDQNLGRNIAREEVERPVDDTETPRKRNECPQKREPVQK